MRIEVTECINCDACIAACPDGLGAVVRLDLRMVIVPELCSGCGLCLPPACPVDCIYPDEQWQRSDDRLIGLIGTEQDPYLAPDPRVSTERIRRW